MASHSNGAAVLPTHSDATFIAHTYARALEDAIPNIDKTLALIRPDGYWRDLLALQWDHRTIHGHDRLRKFLRGGNKLGSDKEPALFSLQVEDGRDAVTAGEAPGGDVCITFFFKFETRIGRGRGCVRLLPDPRIAAATHGDVNGSTAAWTALTVFTALEELKGYEEPLAPERRPNGIVHKPIKHRLTWAERRQREVDFAGEVDQPAVVIVGSGQAGLALAARLKMLDVPTLVLEKHARVGDSWRKRFRQLTLHDNTAYNHMPLLPFPAFWPRFTPKDKLADFFESYASMLELNVWTGATLVRTSYDDAKAEWTLTVRRSDGTERELRPKFLVQATGHSGEPNVPRFEGQDKFRGTVMHSSEFVSGQEYEGKHACVVGACNSGHDIAQDLPCPSLNRPCRWESDAASVTMVQRSSTYVLSIDSVVNILFGSIYNEDRAAKPCPSTEDCDLIFQSTPTAVAKEQMIGATKVIAENDRELLEGLSRAGFKLDFGVDGSGFLMKYLTKGGGYYLDVGASGLIASGEIKLKHGQAIKHFTEDALVFEDGSELRADVVVLATGYQNMRTTTRRIFGDALADRVRDVWDLDEEGEIRTMWRDSGHPGFFFMGGNLALCRYMSKRLALRIKAQLLGLT